jgi:beta-glucosidase
MFSTDERFTTPSPATEKRVDTLLAALSVDDKIALLGGHSRGQSTMPLEHAKIPAFAMADGPLGVHWWCASSTAYPATIGLAATWDRELALRVGQALGRDCRARGVHILLAPGVNIYRSPLCGRNFEYLGEDPYLSAAMVVPYIRGVQSRGVCATVKHYAVNFQEYDHHHVSSDVDERTLHEIYLPAFKAAVREGGVGAVMTAYNLVNGAHCSEHDLLVNTILKKSGDSTGW